MSYAACYLLGTPGLQVLASAKIQFVLFCFYPAHFIKFRNWTIPPFQTSLFHSSPVFQQQAHGQSFTSLSQSPAVRGGDQSSRERSQYSFQHNSLNHPNSQVASQESDNSGVTPENPDLSFLDYLLSHTNWNYPIQAQSSNRGLSDIQSSVLPSTMPAFPKQPPYSCDFSAAEPCYPQNNSSRHSSLRDTSERGTGEAAGCRKSCDILFATSHLQRPDVRLHGKMGSLSDLKSHTQVGHSAQHNADEYDRWRSVQKPSVLQEALTSRKIQKYGSMSTFGSALTASSGYSGKKCADVKQETANMRSCAQPVQQSKHCPFTVSNNLSKICGSHL